MVNTQSQRALKKHIHISVKELVNFLYRQGDIFFPFGQVSKLSGLQGIRAHQKIQNSRPVSTLAEVNVEYRAESENIVLHIHGRIDGIYEKEGQVIIEEIKTSNFELENFIKKNNALHKTQVKIYAALFALKHNLSTLQTQLTYFHVESEKIKTLTAQLTTEELVIFLQTTITLYLEWLDKIELWHKERDARILRSNFPYRFFRDGQIEMIADVANTIKHQEQLMIQAPTGIGKTVAVLYPAIKALAEGHTQKIFYLTARSTGRKIAEKTLRELGEKGLRIKSVTLTAKEKICFNPEKNCTGKECLFAQGYYDRLPEARDAIFSRDFFTMEDIAALALDFSLCPFELSLEMSLWADCIICDINYVFDPRVYLRRYFMTNSEDYTFLIDEAHNLVDRSRDMYSSQIKRSSYLKLKKSLKNKEEKLFFLTEKVCKKLKDIGGDSKFQDSFRWDKDKPQELLPLLKQFCLELERWIIDFPQSYFNKDWIDLFFSTHWFLNVAEMFDDNYATCIEKNDRDLRLKIFCINPSDRLQTAMERAKSLVLFSATITPISYFAKILGCRESINKRILPSPFPSHNLCLCVARSISTLYKKRDSTKDSLTRTLGTFIDTKTGNYFVFFPSYEYMHKILPLYEQAYPHHKILVQKAGMTEDEKFEFLKNFAHENNRSLAGFVVMGGIFGEGIDLSGNRLSGAAVVGVGLPGLSPERELIRHHYSTHNEPGFQYAYLYPGINRVLQAAGRVIRSEKDRGAVLLIDSRYSSLQYNSLFPMEWQTHCVGSNAHMKRILKEFWKAPSP